MESLSGLDAAFLAAETDTMPLNVGGILVFERGTLSEVESYDRILRVFASRIHLLPHFRKKVVNAPFGLVQPYWVDDPSFSLSNHIHLVYPSEEVALNQVLEFAGLILAERFDRARPLWDLFVLPRVEGGRFVLIAKLHHAIIDGISGMEALESLFDLSQESDLATHPVAHIPESPPSRIEVAAMTLFGLTDHTLMALSGGASALKKLPDTFAESFSGHNFNQAEEMRVRTSRTGASGSISSAREVVAHEMDLKKLSVIAKRHGV
ncbi:MAG: hypothetical protein HKL84_08625 [Acidimicrobiaceae bacterium]|nr:hypothetical protein [Acidimicrobiaceae bacterium]